VGDLCENGTLEIIHSGIGDLPVEAFGFSELIPENCR
jgi:hypothetical protein